MPSSVQIGLVLYFFLNVFHSMNPPACLRSYCPIVRSCDGLYYAYVQDNVAELHGKAQIHVKYVKKATDDILIA
jgi:hypothetical protein